MPLANMEKFYSEIGLESTYYVDIVIKKSQKCIILNYEKLHAFIHRLKRQCMNLLMVIINMILCSLMVKDASLY